MMFVQVAPVAKAFTGGDPRPTEGRAPDNPKQIGKAHKKETTNTSTLNKKQQHRIIMLFSSKTLFAALAVASITDPVTATMKKGYIQVVNKAPQHGTCQTPVWVGIHDGQFDTYDRDMPTSAALEPPVEDGDNEPVTEDFAHTAGTVWDGSVGNAPHLPR